MTASSFDYGLSKITIASLDIPLQAVGNATYGSPQIQSIRMSKESQLETIPYPTRDSQYSIVLDIMGVIRNITITGNVQGTTAQLQQFIYDLEARINGNQYNNTAPTKTVQFTTSIGGKTSAGKVTYNVVIKTFSWTFDAGVPGQINYTLEMVEGST